MLWWVAVQLRSLMHKRKKWIQGILEKKMTSQNKKKRKERKKRIQMTSNRQEKMFYTWKLKHTQNKTCHKSQWSTRIISHSLWPHTCALITLLKDRGQCRTSPRSKQVLNGLQHRELEMLPLPQGSGTKTHKYICIMQGQCMNISILLCFFLENLDVVISEKDDSTHMMLLDIQGIVHMMIVLKYIYCTW